MIRILLTLAILLALAGEAAAEDAAPPSAPRLKELVSVTSEIVRIGDLVDNAGAAAGIPVFRAPDLGQTGTVRVARIMDALRRNDLPDVDAGGLSEVVVTRLSRTITGKEIEERILRAFAGQYGFGEAGNLTVTIDRDLRVLHVESVVTAELAVARMNVDPRTGRFDVALELPGSAAARRLPLRFTGTVMETTEAVMLVRSLARGDIIKASDVRTVRRPKAEVGGEPFSAEEAVGLSAKRLLRAAQMVRAADLMKPEVVQRNEPVTIVYQVPGIVLTMRGKALDAGGMGDVIGVQNIQSNRTIQAAIAGPGRVTIAATMPPVAAAVASASDEMTERPTQ